MVLPRCSMRSISMSKTSCSCKGLNTLPKSKGLAEWKVDFSAIGDMVGTVEGIAEGVASQSYMGGLIRDAHRKATHEFDIAVATVAQTGYLSHVYEFGTAGITPGPARLQPDSPEARLWTHGITGQGSAQDI